MARAVTKRGRGGRAVDRILADSDALRVRWTTGGGKGVCFASVSWLEGDRSSEALSDGNRLLRVVGEVSGLVLGAGPTNQRPNLPLFRLCE